MMLNIKICDGSELIHLISLDLRSALYNNWRTASSSVSSMRAYGRFSYELQKPSGKIMVIV